LAESVSGIFGRIRHGVPGLESANSALSHLRNRTGLTVTDLRKERTQITGLGGEVFALATVLDSEKMHVQIALETVQKSLATLGESVTNILSKNIAAG
jgi:hypothetical protein